MQFCSHVTDGVYQCDLSLPSSDGIFGNCHVKSFVLLAVPRAIFGQNDDSVTLDRYNIIGV